MNDKKLKLWNGRLHRYEHGYVAAESRADAAQVIQENYGGGGWEVELRDYWNKNAWGTRMLGITPERGLWAELKGNKGIVRIVNRKEVVVGITPERAAYEAQQQSECEARDAERKQVYLEKCERVFRVWQLLNQAPFKLFQQMRDQDVATFEFEGHKYQVTEIE